MPKVVTTNWPDEDPREVSDEEYADLQHLGLLVADKSDPAPAAADQPDIPAKKKKES